MAYDPTRFSIRQWSDQLYKVEIEREAATHMPSALSHVGKDVFAGIDAVLFRDADRAMEDAVCGRGPDLE